MAKSLSEDIRSHLIVAVDGGMSCRGAVEWFGVTVATPCWWVREWRRFGSVCAKPGADGPDERGQGSGLAQFRRPRC